MDICIYCLRSNQECEKNPCQESLREIVFDIASKINKLETEITNLKKSDVILLDQIQRLKDD